MGRHKDLLFGSFLVIILFPVPAFLMFSFNCGSIKAAAEKEQDAPKIPFGDSFILFHAHNSKENINPRDNCISTVTIEGVKGEEIVKIDKNFFAYVLTEK
jgi:hypothetical protein